MSEAGRQSDGGRSGPFVAEPSGSLNSALVRNIGVLAERRRQDSFNAGTQDRIADAITRFAGSMTFVYIHLAAYGFWIAANLGWVPGVRAWDPSFVVLAMEASVEAIFLSTFVLISQNRGTAAANRRDDLDLQITLLTEHEVTRIAAAVHAIADKLGVAVPNDPDAREIEQDVAPEAVLDVLEGTRSNDEP